MDPFTAYQADGDQGRIAPDNWTAPDGEYVLCLGHDEPGVFVWLNPGDEIEWSQTEDFDTSTALAFRGRTRGPTNLPHLVNVTALATQTYTVTINGTAYEYVADTAGLPVSGQTGSVASLDVIDGAGWVTVSGLTGMDEDESVGRMLTLSGCATGANNGTFPIREWIDATSVKIENASGVVPDGNNGSISWIERRSPDTVNMIAAALRDVINASTVATARNHTDGVLALWPVDADEELLVSVGTSLDEDALVWTVTMEIDASVYFSQTITKGRTRERFDGGANLVHLGAGTHALAFKLALSSSMSGPVEIELPAVYIDSIVLTG